MFDAMAYHKANPDEDETTLEHYLPMPAVLKPIPRSTYINGVGASQVPTGRR